MDPSEGDTEDKFNSNNNFVKYDRILVQKLMEEKGDTVIQYINEFHALPTNLEKVDVMYNDMTRYDLMKERFFEDEKNDGSAKRHKKKGDNNFARGQIVVALKHFTRCIMQAKSDELLSMAYANRSATLFKLRLFPECIQDIDRAIALSYPQKLRPSLITRQNKAREKAERTRPPKYYEQPPCLAVAARNINIPRAHASQKIEVRINQKQRRRIFATKDLNIGEVIAIEHPITYTIGGNSDLYHCHNCFNICYNPIPCKTCTQTVYCTDKCRDEALSKYHKFECPILGSLKQWVGYCKSLLVAVRIMLLREDQTFRQECEQYVDPLHRKLSTKEEVNREIFLMSVAASVIFYFIKEHTQLFPKDGSEVRQNKFKEELLKYARLCFAFGCGISETYPHTPNPQEPLEVIDHDRKVIACGMFPFYLHFRHSCAPNVIINHYGAMQVMRTVRSIKPGKELFVNYGPHFYYSFPADRQRELKKLYHFQCVCRACSGEYPVMTLQSYVIADAEIATLVYHIKRGLLHAVFDGMIRFMEIIQTEQRQENSTRLYFYTRSLAFCYDLLANRRHIP